MATTLVFATATPLMEPSERMCLFLLFCFGTPSERQEELSWENAIVQAQNVTQATYAECVASCIQKKLQHSTGGRMLEFLFRDKMAQFQQIAQINGPEGSDKMDLGDLQAIDKKFTMQAMA